jgi:hypothetical protein
MSATDFFRFFTVLSLFRGMLRVRPSFLVPSSWNKAYGTNPTVSLKGLAIGRARVRNGSNVIETFLHSRQVTVDFSYPYIRSTIMDLFLARNAYQCSLLTSESGLPLESCISTYGF